jgi:hypothetical protein
VLSRPRIYYIARGKANLILPGYHKRVIFRCCTFAALSEVEMVYPRSLNYIRNDNENERLYAELLSKYLYMQYDVTYSVLVKVWREERRSA